WKPTPQTSHPANLHHRLRAPRRDPDQDALPHGSRGQRSGKAQAQSGEAGKAAAPYVHPRLAAMVHAHAGGKTLEQLVAASYAAEALLTDASEKVEPAQTIEGEVVERETET